MAAVNIPDLILDHILARLPAKSLLRCKCVSKHWNRLITDPSFMKSRARRMILVTDYQLFNFIDDNDSTHSMLKIQAPYEHGMGRYREVRVLGTINGIVLLHYFEAHKAIFPPDFVGDLMLCNPFTRKYMLLPNPYNSAFCKRSIYWQDDYRFPHNITYAYGFGYGNATPDDLKIVRFKEYNKHCRYNSCGGGVCEVFSLKTFTWSKPRDMNIQHIGFEETVGKFLNGFLYWIPFRMNMLIVFDVANLVLSEMHLPFQRSYNSTRSCDRSHLGTIHGCLCLLNRSINDIDFNLWVMNEQADENSWSKRCSFTLDADSFRHHFVCILDNGRILMSNIKKLIIYDTSDDSYTLTDVSTSPHRYFPTIHGIEYVETPVSLSDVCSA